MNWNEIINKIDELDNKLLIPKEENLEKANLKETFKTMANDDFETFYEVLKERDEHEKEIERLNNIIEELEKWLKEEADFWKQKQEEAIKNGWLEFGGKYNTTIIYENAINKLKELKKGDKNEENKQEN